MRDPARVPAFRSKAVEPAEPIRFRTSRLSSLGRHRKLRLLATFLAVFVMIFPGPLPFLESVLTFAQAAPVAPSPGGNATQAPSSPRVDPAASSPVGSGTVTQTNTTVQPPSGVPLAPQTSVSINPFSGGLVVTTTYGTTAVPKPFQETLLAAQLIPMVMGD